MNSSAADDSSRPTPADETIEEAAIAWLLEREDGLSPAREREFGQWLHADPRHEAALSRLGATFGLLRELPRYRTEINTEFDRAAPVVPFPPPAPKTTRWPRPRLLAWAAGAAAVLVLGVISLSRPPPAVSDVRYTTTPAGYERARLDDGSTLELNAATAVRVRFTSAERHASIEAGEAHFEVAHDEARPFIVTAGDVAVRAVGTAFNVRYAGEEEIEVTVTEGKVRIGQAGPASSVAASALLVKAGERAVVAKQRPRPAVEKVSSTSLRTALAWQSRLADFADAPLSDVIARFNTRSQIRLVIDDPALAERRIGGTFALDEAEAFVRLLERDGEIVGDRGVKDEIHLRRAR